MNLNLKSVPNMCTTLPHRTLPLTILHFQDYLVCRKKSDKSILFYIPLVVQFCDISDFYLPGKVQPFHYKLKSICNLIQKTSRLIQPLRLFFKSNII